MNPVEIASIAVVAEWLLLIAKDEYVENDAVTLQEIEEVESTYGSIVLITASLITNIKADTLSYLDSKINEIEVKK